MTDERQSLTKRIREASDIVAVIGSYLTLVPAGGAFKAVCPFHNDTRPSLHVDPKWQNYRCWACGKKGDVFTFVCDFEKVRFVEAREILARRAGINLDANPEENIRRGKLLDAVKWAERQYQDVLHESPLGERARMYLGGRKLTGPTVRNFGLGFAPGEGNWLVRLAKNQRIDLDLLQEVGLIADSQHGGGHYDRFRDRVMFPIRDARGQTVGFGGRILPDSPHADRGPKYYNSAETPLFQKKELLYGLDLARNAAAHEGYLAVVEGYTDVMMAHQHGVTPVVATMGTALNAAHVRQLRRFVPKVVLVFDADAGGTTGVDRALEIFIECDVELAIATLPDGLDPCDLLTARGAAPFRAALAAAVDALDFKLTQLATTLGGSVDGSRRMVDEILKVMAMAPAALGQAGQVKQELMLTRIAQRVGLLPETVRKRFAELRESAKAGSPRMPVAEPAAPQARSQPARALEKELLQILLADPSLIATANAAIAPDDLEHPGLRKLLAALYDLFSDDRPADIDGLRERIDSAPLVDWAMENMQVGRESPDRQGWLARVIGKFQSEERDKKRRHLRERMRAAVTDEERRRLLGEIQDLDRGPDAGKR